MERLITIEDQIKEQQDKQITMLLEGRWQQVKKEIESGRLDINQQFYTKKYLLHYLVTNSRNNFFLTKLLAEYGDKFQLDLLDNIRSTPLIAAAIFENVEAMEILIEKGANPDLRNNRQKKAIDILRQTRPFAARDIMSMIDSQKEVLKKSADSKPQTELIQHHSSQAKATNTISSTQVNDSQKSFSVTNSSWTRFFSPKNWNLVTKTKPDQNLSEKNPLLHSKKNL